MITCEFCNREFSNVGGRGAHVPYCKLNPTRVQRKKSPNACPKKGSIGWSRGLTKHTDSRMLNLSIANKGKPGNVGLKHTEEVKKRLSEVAKERKLGGYIKGSGRGKKGWYKGFFCDSSWELAYVIYCLDHGIDIKRNTEKRLYEYKGKIKNYIPDFIVEGEIIEIKGFKTEEWLAKLEFNPDVKVLYENDLKSVLDYVTLRYSKEFIKLYE